ncbi:MAG: hypothetical protein ABI977_02385 [Acidobacteriota bacterium]
MFGFLKRLIFGRNEKKLDAVVHRSSENAIVSVNADSLDAEDRVAMRDLLREKSGLDFFQGRVQHGFGLRDHPDSSKCPRCGAETRQQYANFLYLVGSEARAMLAPGGYFCRKCPTVIVDEEIIKTATRNKAEFKGVIGIVDDDERKPPQIFRTWEGILVLLPGEDIEDVLEMEDYSSRGATAYSEKEYRKATRKRRMARESRKRNRRK